MKQLSYCSRTLAVLVGVLAFALASPAWAGVGSGALTVDNDGCGGNDACATKPQPVKWDVTPGSPIHIHIEATAGTCTSGPRTGQACSGTSDCSLNTTCNPGTHRCKGTEFACASDTDCVVPGTCTPGSLECTGATTVWVKGKHGTCQASQVGSQGDCDTGEECVAESTESGTVYTCKFAIPYPAVSTGSSIDVCVTTPGDGCFTAAVAYCSIGNEAADNTPMGTGSRAASGIRFVNSCASAGTCSVSGAACLGTCPIDAGNCDGFVPPDVIEDCGERPPQPCSNEVGSFCCGLTQGAYGAPNSIATAPCSAGTPSNCPSSPATAGAGCGFIAAACSQGCNIFAGDPDATTAGIHGTRAVTINNLATLQAYLPIGSTAGCFKTSGPSAVGADTHYGTPGAIPDLNPAQSASRGEGGGVLAGQAMATRLNDYLSSCSTFGGSSVFTASGFSGFQIPSSGALVCTKTSGGDKVLGTGDDVCRAFQYPACTWGQTIGNVLAATNAFLASGPTCADAILGCSATDLNAALTNANEEFDNCGVVIDCGAQTTAGTFTCP
ncbi:MAG: hypothetical protein HY049_14955 [Acidobacteria bacterium]|nr:hypothetical protein [Acidobacteriota bacterium]